MKGLNKMNYELFKNMKPMKYYENDWKLPKAQEMINNTNNEFFAMRKHDGEWSRAIIDLDGNVLMQSRSISTKTKEYGDKTAYLPHIVDELKNFFPPGTVLLGEIAFNDWESTSRETASIMRSLPARAVRLQTEEHRKLHFFVFDVLAYDGRSLMDEPFYKRFTPNHTERPDAKYISTPMNHSGKDAIFMDFADHVWKNGGEGIMIVRKDMKYQPGGRRAWQTLKLKKKLGELSVDVIGALEPNRLYEGNNENWDYIKDGVKVTKPYYYGWKNGVLIHYDGRHVNVTSGLTDEDREWLSTPEAQKMIEENKLKGVVSGMELTEDSIRHPILKFLVKTK